MGYNHLSSFFDEQTVDTQSNNENESSSSDLASYPGSVWGTQSLGTRLLLRTMITVR